MARALSLGLDHTVKIVAPLRQLSKAKVIQLGLELQVPFELTMSCSPLESETIAANAVSVENATMHLRLSASKTLSNMWLKSHDFVDC